MLASATHDTKRGEDARARLAVLSELPGGMAAAGRRAGAGSCARGIGDVEGRAPPDRNDEYMFYQMLVGSWPMELLDEPTAEGLEAYRARIRAALEKSMREAKLRSSWAAPNAEYEEAMLAFASRRCGLRARFSGELPAVRRARRAARGRRTASSRPSLKLTAPGVPDIYQGCELWDLSLVDPDNRRAVDYACARAGAGGARACGSSAPRSRGALFRPLMRDVARRAGQAGDDGAPARVPPRIMPSFSPRAATSRSR